AILVEAAVDLRVAEGEGERGAGGHTRAARAGLVVVLERGILVMRERDPRLEGLGLGRRREQAGRGLAGRGDRGHQGHGARRRRGLTREGRRRPDLRGGAAGEGEEGEETKRARKSPAKHRAG